MSAIAEVWVALSPTTQALLQGVALMLLVQGYKGAAKRIPKLPPLQNAEPRLKQAIVAFCALLVAWWAAPEGATWVSILLDWAGSLTSAITSHQALTAWINEPAKRAREANGG